MTECSCRWIRGSWTSCATPKTRSIAPTCYWLRGRRRRMADRALANVRVLAFDVFGTVVDWRGGVTAEMAAVAKEHHLSFDAPAFADAWRSKYLPYLLRIRNGEMPWQVLDGVHRASLRELVAELSLH